MHYFPLFLCKMKKYVFPGCFATECGAVPNATAPMSANANAARGSTALCASTRDHSCKHSASRLQAECKEIRWGVWDQIGVEMV